MLPLLLLMIGAEPRLPRDDLLVGRDGEGRSQPVKTIDDWQKRRTEVVRGMVANGLGFSILNFPLKSNRTVDGEDFVIKHFKDSVNATTLGIAQSRTMKPRQVVHRFSAFCETCIRRLHLDT